MARALRPQALSVTVPHMAARQKADHRHAGRDAGLNARLAVLDHQHPRGIDAHVVGRIEEHVRMRLAALDVVRSGERVDLLLTDMGLPGLDGRRLAEAARRLRPGLRVLFVTGEACDAAGGRPLPPGTQVVGKPVAPDALAAEVRAMLAA